MDRDDPGEAWGLRPKSRRSDAVPAACSANDAVRPSKKARHAHGGRASASSAGAGSGSATVGTTTVAAPSAPVLPPADPQERGSCDDGHHWLRSAVIHEASVEQFRIPKLPATAQQLRLFVGGAGGALLTRDGVCLLLAEAAHASCHRCSLTRVHAFADAIAAHFVALCGPSTRFQRMLFRDSGKPRGFGFLTGTDGAAFEAVLSQKFHTILGCRVRCCTITHVMVMVYVSTPAQVELKATEQSRAWKPQSDAPEAKPDKGFIHVHVRERSKLLRGLISPSLNAACVRVQMVLDLPSQDHRDAVRHIRGHAAGTQVAAQPVHRRVKVLVRDNTALDLLQCASIADVGQV